MRDRTLFLQALLRVYDLWRLTFFHLYSWFLLSFYVFYNSRGTFDTF